MKRNKRRVESLDRILEIHLELKRMNQKCLSDKGVETYQQLQNAFDEYYDSLTKDYNA